MRSRRLPLILSVVAVLGILFFIRSWISKHPVPAFPSALRDGSSESTRESDEVSAMPLSQSVHIAKSWFIAGTSPIELAGRVFLDGAPAFGVPVTVVDELTTEGLLPPQTTVSDSDGRFVFASVPRIHGWYRLVVTRSGASPSWAMAPGDAPKRDVELRLETCRTHVYGVVSDASGGVVAEAKVFFDKVPAHVATTDAMGRFRLCAVRSGRLRVEAEGYGPSLRTVSARGAQRQDVTLIPAASITGSVVVAQSSMIVPFALVTLRAAGENIREVQADDHGQFEIEGVAPGTYAIEARAAGMRSQHPIDVAVFASSRATVRVVVDRRARVLGRVISASGPLAGNGIQMGFSATQEWSSAVRTNEDGTFAIDDVPIGNVLVTVDDHEVETPRTLRTSEGGLANVTINVAAKARLVVTVTREGRPVSGATVYARGANSSVTRTTNAAGSATFRGLGEVAYRLVTEYENDFAVLERVQVSRETEAHVSLELSAGRQIAGRVVDEHGAAVDGARVSFGIVDSTEDGGASAISGPDGSFRGGPLRAPATYRVRITRSGFPLSPKDEWPRLTVTASGSVVPASLVLVVAAQDKSLAGVVLDGAQGPVRDARIIVTRIEPHADVLATTFTGNDGAFALHGLGAGPWAVKASAPSGSEAEAKPVLLPRSDLRIELPPVGTVRGTVRNFTHTPSVMVWSVAGYDWDFHPAAVESGRFSVSGLSRGRYHVAASSTDGAAQTTVVVDGPRIVDVDLVSSNKRTIVGKTLDFISGDPLPGMNCQVAPYVDGARSPVVVPGSVFSDAQGAFELVDVPAADLYMWCTSEGSFRGGVARMPSDLGAKALTVWGLAMRGRTPFDAKTLGMTMADDHPFSREIAAVEPKGAAERSGLRVGDVFETIGEKSLQEVGNGMVRNYLALLLTSERTVSLAVRRAGEVVPLTFKLD